MNSVALPISGAGRSGPAAALAAWAGLAVAITVALATVNAPSLTLLGFGVALTLTVLLPGLLLLDLARVSASPLERLVLGLSLGLVLGAVVQGVSVGLGEPTAVDVYAVGASSAALWRMRRGFGRLRCALGSLGWPHAALAFVAMGTAAAQFSVAYQWHNLTTDGSRLAFSPVADALLHLGMAHELTRSVPPGSPFASGGPFAYHWGGDLWAPLLGHLGGPPIADLTLRILPVFFAILLALSAFCLARRWLHSAWAAVLVAALIVFGEDLSYIPGVLNGYRGNYWSIEYFQLPSTFSLYSLNPMLPALALLAAGLLALERWDAVGGRWLWVAAPILAVMVEVKVFVFAQLMLALGVAALLGGCSRRDWRLLRPIAAILALASPLVLIIATGNGPQPVLGIHLTSYATTALHQVLGEQHPTGLLGHADRMLSGTFDPLGLALAVGLVLPLFAFGVLGLRALALPGALRALRVPADEPALRGVVAVFVLIGLPISWLLSIKLKTATPAGQLFDNGGWFAVASKGLMWLLAVEALLRFAARRRARVGVLLGCGLLAFSIPSMVQAQREQSRLPVGRLDASSTSILAATRRACERGSTVLASPSLVAPVVAVAGCRVPYAGTLTDTTSPPSLATASAAAVARFWAGWSSGAPVLGVLRKLHVRYVLVDTNKAGPAPRTKLLRRQRARGSVALYAVT